MEYIYVMGGKSQDIETDRSIITLTGHALHSLIDGMRKHGFGLDTMQNVACSIRSKLITIIKPTGGKIAIDSGGYSFIRGDVHPSEIDTMIECYHVYSETEHEQFNHIFSLDIPISLKHTSFNTAQRIMEANKSSLMRTRELLIKQPELYKKTSMVWHFKIDKQFAVWKQLYKDLELRRFILNHAVGGLVGLKKATGIKHAPFIGISFYILYQHLHSDFAGEEFRLHYLGVYAKNDRFLIAFLHKLFQYYLTGIGKINVSYDSINPAHTVRMNAEVPFYLSTAQGLQVYPTLLDVPEEVLDDIATTPDHAQHIMAEMKRRKNRIRLEDTNSFVPLNVFSNLELDRFFESIIDEYDLIRELCTTTSQANLHGKLRRIFKDAGQKYPTVFTSEMLKYIFKSLERTWYWHRLVR